MFASPARTPRSPRSERRTAAWPTSHAVIIGLLVYIAAFQGILRVFQGRGAIDPLNRTYNERIRDIPNLKDLPPVKLPLQNTTPANFHPFPWRRQSPKEIKVPYPIFVTSLPKTGTTSVFKYFRCGGVRSSHTFINKPGAAKSMLAGKCMHENIVKGNPPFEGCGTTDLFSDTGVRIFMRRIALNRYGANLVPCFIDRRSLMALSSFSSTFFPVHHPSTTVY